jgi:hypothetical protein
MAVTGTRASTLRRHVSTDDALRVPGRGVRDWPPGRYGLSKEYQVTHSGDPEQARDLAERSPEASVPRQHYAAFHVEFLLESDDSVRGTRVHHHQTDARESWAGWDADKLLTFLRDRIPLPGAAAPADAPGPEPAQAQPDEPAQAQAGDRGPGSDESAEASPAPGWLPSWSLGIEELAPIRDGQPSHTLPAGEPHSVRLTMRIDPAGPPSHGSFDFSATIAARRLGGHDRLPVGTAHGTLSVGDHVRVEVTGPALPADLYRLVAAVDIYSAGHSPEGVPVYEKRVAGDLLRVADVPPGSVPAAAGR